MEETYLPVIGQKGKDVFWAPCPYNIIDLMLKIGKIKPGDVLIDLGSGDGRIVIAATKFQAHAIGVEYDHNLVEYSKNMAIDAGVYDDVKFIEGDFYDTDLSMGTIITTCLHPIPMRKLKPRFKQLEPGTRIVSYIWDMEGWEPDFKLGVDKDTYIFLWIV